MLFRSDRDMSKTFNSHKGITLSTYNEKLGELSILDHA